MKKYIVNGKDIIAELKEQSPIPVLCSTPRQCKKMVKNHRRMYWSITGAGFYSNKACNGWCKNELNMPDTFIWINSEIEVYRQLTALWHEIQHAQCLNSKCHCRSYENIDGHPNVMLEYHAYLATLLIAVKKQLPLPFLQVIQNVIQLASEKQQPYANACKMIQKLQMFKYASNQYWRNYEKKDHNSIHPWPKNNDNQWQIEWETIKCNGNIPKPINENPILNPLNPYQ